MLKDTRTGAIAAEPIAILKIACSIRGMGCEIAGVRLLSMAVLACFVSFFIVIRGHYRLWAMGQTLDLNAELMMMRGMIHGVAGTCFLRYRWLWIG